MNTVLNITLQSRYKLLFTIAAVLNCIGSLTALLAMPLHLQMFYGEHAQTIANATLFKFYHYNFWAVVLVMGIGYWLVSRDILRNRALIFAGAAGKLTAAISWLYLWSIGQATGLVLLGVLYDASFGVLFGYIFWQTRFAAQTRS